MYIFLNNATAYLIDFSIVQTCKHWETKKLIWLALLWYLLYCRGLNPTHNISRVSILFEVLEIGESQSVNKIKSFRNEIFLPFLPPSPCFPCPPLFLSFFPKTQLFKTVFFPKITSLWSLTDTLFSFRVGVPLNSIPWISWDVCYKPGTTSEGKRSPY